MNRFDDRLVTLTVEVDGTTTTYDQNYDIRATGAKYTNGSLGECALKISNIAKDQRDFLVTKTSPWNLQRTYANVSLYVGRQSTGKFLLFTGQAKACNPTQPPDIGLLFISLTLGIMLGNIGSLNGGQICKASVIAKQIADQLSIPLDYQAKTDPQIGNYVFTGAVVKQIDKLNEFVGIHAFLDNNKLVVVDTNPPQDGAPQISAETGMIGVPEVTELGVTVRMLILNELKQGMWVNVQSNINKAANGMFWIYKLSFEVSSRDTPFYWILECRKYGLGLGVNQ